MKLIILHHYSDGYTFWGTDTIPVERESEEALIVELEDWANSDPSGHEGWKGTGIYSSTVLGTNEHDSIEIMTLEEWWQQEKIV